MDIQITEKSLWPDSFVWDCEYRWYNGSPIIKAWFSSNDSE